MCIDIAAKTRREETSFSQCRQKVSKTLLRSEYQTQFYKRGLRGNLCQRLIAQSGLESALDIIKKVERTRIRARGAVVHASILFW